MFKDVQIPPSSGIAIQMTSKLCVHKQETRQSEEKNLDLVRHFATAQIRAHQQATLPRMRLSFVIKMYESNK